MGESHTIKLFASFTQNTSGSFAKRLRERLNWQQQKPEEY